MARARFAARSAALALGLALAATFATALNDPGSVALDRYTFDKARERARERVRPAAWTTPRRAARRRRQQLT